MQKKHLPIKFFEKRKTFDDRSTEGGGDSRQPAWVLCGDALSKHSFDLMQEIQGVSKVFDISSTKNKKLPLVISTSIDDNAIAKSHRSNVTALYAIVKLL